MMHIERHNHALLVQWRQQGMSDCGPPTIRYDDDIVGAGQLHQILHLLMRSRPNDHVGDTGKAALTQIENFLATVSVRMKRPVLVGE